MRALRVQAQQCSHRLGSSADRLAELRVAAACVHWAWQRIVLLVLLAYYDLALSVSLDDATVDPRPDRIGISIKAVKGHLDFLASLPPPPQTRRAIVELDGTLLDPCDEFGYALVCKQSVDAAVAARKLCFREARVHFIVARPMEYNNISVCCLAALELWNQMMAALELWWDVATTQWADREREN